MKAAVVYLTQKTHITGLMHSLTLLQRNLLDAYDYPVILFHEGDFNSDDAAYLQQVVPNLSLRQIDFAPPAHVDLTAQHTWRMYPKHGVGYRCMCRFFALNIFSEIQDLDYYMRLDDDSFIQSPIPFDPFVRMADSGKLYGYRARLGEPAGAVAGLKYCLEQYSAQFSRCNLKRIYYNNFHITKPAIWLEAPFRDALLHIDADGGIFTNRWGDAPIQTALVNMYLKPEQVHHFTAFSYKHGRHSWAVGK